MNPFFVTCFLETEPPFCPAKYNISDPANDTACDSFDWWSNPLLSMGGDNELLLCDDTDHR